MMKSFIVAATALLMVQSAWGTLFPLDEGLSLRAPATDCVPTGPGDMTIEVNSTDMFYVRPHSSMTYPKDYSCGLLLVGTGENKMKIKCVVNVLENDYMVVVSQGVQEVFTNTHIQKFYRIFNTPVVYVGFKAGSHGTREKQAFYCRVYG